MFGWMFNVLRMNLAHGLFALSLCALSCDSPQGVARGETADQRINFTGKSGEVKLMTLDPGHFHASLIQKSMYDQVDSVVYVYAPKGDEVTEHLKKISQFNTASECPTNWEEKVYRGPDYLEKMIEEKPGNVMVVAGNNAKKTRYIHSAIKSGINVFADKPMVINPEEYPLLKEAFEIAEQKGLLLYDIMTERFEITTLLQKELSQMSEIFGEMEKGSVEDPAISKESVHHFSKYVAGNPLKRPPWFFDIEQEGAGIVDVSTHLVDLILWECFPEQGISQNEVQVINAKRWSTKLTPENFQQITGLSAYPDYLIKDVGQDSAVDVFSNGEFVFTTRGIYGKVSVIWNFQAPEDAKDTHFSIMRGSTANLVIRQEQEQQFISTLYVEPNSNVDKDLYESTLGEAIQKLSEQYPGLSKKLTPSGWEIIIPKEYRVGHEAHFRQVTEKYLQYLIDGKLPEWEVSNMLAKYYITMEAYKKSQ